TVHCALRIDGSSSNLPRGGRQALANQFGVTPKTVSKLWSNDAEQLAKGKELCLDSRRERSAGEEATIKSLNADLRTLTVQKLASKLKELGVQKSRTTIFRWLNEMGAQMKRRWIKPRLLDHHGALRTEFVVDQVNNRYGTFHDMFNVVHIDESWFYLMVDDQKIRVFPVGDMPGAPKLQHKSRKSCLLWQMGPQIRKKNSTERSEFGVCVSSRRPNVPARIVRGEWDLVYDAPEPSNQAQHALDGEGGEISVQQDDATPHTGKGNLEWLSEAGKRQGFHIKLCTQPAQSPDSNINDL
ncbi:unnamed protein product, partial [Discosporangium mesarthrocarpum]